MAFQAVNQTIDLSSFTLPSLSRKAVALLKFENFPITDEITSTKATIEGQQFPIIEPGVFGNGLRMRPSSHVTLPILLKNSTQLSLSFWLNPVSLKPAISPLTGDLNFYRMSLFDKAKFQYNSTSGMISAFDATFVVMEEGRSETENVLIITLYDEDDNETMLESQPYPTGELHHFFFSYLGPSNEVKLFIDGIETDLVVISGSVPSELNNKISSPLHINFSAIGNNTLLRNNFGLIEELLIESGYSGSSAQVASYVNLGAESAIDENESFSEEIALGFVFDDPTAITIKSVFGNGTNVYAGRSDGALLKGNRTMWQANRDFSDPNEEGALSKRILDSGGSVSLNDGSLRVSKASVRLR